jgi:plastocyanin
MAAAKENAPSCFFGKTIIVRCIIYFKLNNKIIIGIGLIILLIGAFVFLSKNNSSSAIPATSIPQPTVPVSPNTIEIKNFAFSPAELIVKKGTTVTWVNQDSVTHRIKSDTFNSQDLNQGASFSFIFDTVGSFDYICGIHTSMTGNIKVE